jgi:inhibitor of KinA
VAFIIVERKPGYTSAKLVIPVEQHARIQFASDQSLLVYFEQAREKAGVHSGVVDEKILVHANEKVRRLLRLLQLEPVEGVRNLHPAYASLLIEFDGLRIGHEEVETNLRRYLTRIAEVELLEARLVEIPVCYGGEFGVDLELVAELRGMTAARVAEMHSSVEYLVYFLGFVPGFGYLGELPRELVTPRLPTPRRVVPAGSVGIAGNQTGVYPLATPGGWRLIGRTPMKMFRSGREACSVLSIGDRVRFVAITAEEFVALEKKWA